MRRQVRCVGFHKKRRVGSCLSAGRRGRRGGGGRIGAGRQSDGKEEEVAGGEAQKCERTPRRGPAAPGLIFAAEPVKSGAGSLAFGRISRANSNQNCVDTVHCSLPGPESGRYYPTELSAEPEARLNPQSSLKSSNYSLSGRPSRSGGPPGGARARG